ncbi:CDP-alcohol phosphatidyltransferase family protein [Nocardiopsis sp. NRRL B-16309]|uniref:CDP-alcohol phosphatidyltransferase family protein n=1 Tax=Nocardiopsis sp. NRRL B-16309 TaxID=1519494 RepID=UPI0006AE2E87|nr:CDP-alcohol phosphatidyltransferase family protein [Nocardiopsis sp. NRRL B-16309]KOX15631.1 CDP-alcohol phosphatidyltransferase [Nocardiopsis sp. NRRL B-16309]
MCAPSVAAGVPPETGILASAGLGLGPVGWAMGAVYLVAGAAALRWAMRRAGRRSLGPADRVTLVRAVLVGGVTALVADGGHTWAVVALAVPALLLDLVDGFVARHTRTESDFGARFDMETDAFLILVLSVHAVQFLGPWVLVIGAMRYVFGAAAWAAPWLAGPLPPSQARKGVAALQGAALAAAAPALLPVWAAAVLVAGALGALLWSFGRDVVWLWRSRECGTALIAHGE